MERKQKPVAKKTICECIPFKKKGKSMKKDEKMPEAPEEKQSIDNSTLGYVYRSPNKGCGCNGVGCGKCKPNKKPKDPHRKSEKKEPRISSEEIRKLGANYRL